MLSYVDTAVGERSMPVNAASSIKNQTVKTSIAASGTNALKDPVEQKFQKPVDMLVYQERISERIHLRDIVRLRQEVQQLI